MDVMAERVIPLPPDRVAEYAMDWRHDAEWTQGIRRVELTAEADGGGFGVGAEITRTTYYLGLQVDYVQRVTVYEPPTLMETMSIAGAFPMWITYRFDKHPDGTLVSMRVRGNPTGIYKAGALWVRWVIRTHLRRDLRDIAHNLIPDA